MSKIYDAEGLCLGCGTERGHGHTKTCPYIKAEYLKAPSECPYCKTSNITSEPIEFADGWQAWADVECHSCGKKWQDIYKLVDVELKG